MQLVACNPALSWAFTEDADNAGWWQPRCDWCGVGFNRSSDANALRVIRQHLTSKHHRERRAPSACTAWAQIRQMGHGVRSPSSSVGTGSAQLA